NSMSKASNLSASLLQRPLFDSYQTTLMLGGIMVYFQGINATTSAYGQYIANETSTNTLSVQNGTYQAYSIGYTAPGMTGSLKCGVGNSGSPIIFNGSPQSVSFVLDNAGCSKFSPNPAGSNFSAPTVTLHSCNRVQTDPTKDLCPPIRIGNILSVGYQLRTYIKEQVTIKYPSDAISVAGVTPINPESINMPCLPLSAGIAIYPVTIPIGIRPPPFQMPIAIYGFQTASCSAPFGTYLFDSNLATGPEHIIRPDGTLVTFSGDIPSKTVPFATDGSRVNLFLRDFSESGTTEPLPTAPH
ncbi:MAG: hypothetical protein ABIQ95_13810, partial [Bdellovibrionia bacterium]